MRQNLKVAVTSRAPLSTIFGSVKKGITPVVATALLLVVVVVAVVGFQTWFNSYSSGLFTKIDQQSSSNSLSVKGLIGNVLYLQSGSNTNLTSLSVENYAGKTMCSFSGLTNVSSQGLVGWWKFNKIENQSGTLKIKDYSGNGNDAIAITSKNITTTGLTNSTFIQINNAGIGNLKNYYVSYAGNTAKIIDYQIPKTGVIVNMTLNQSLPGLTSNKTITVSGSMPLITAGKIGNSIYFNYSYPFEVPFKSTFNSKNFSVSYWFKDSSNQDYNRVWADLVDRWYCNSSCIGWWTGIDILNSTQLGYKNLYFVGVPQGVYSNLTVLETNRWNSEIFTYNNTNLNTYINLEKSSKSNFTEPTINNNTNPIYFGTSGHTVPSSQYGKYLDQVRYYDRILSLQEIRNLYFEGISNLNSGINQIDLSSCNLTKGQVYDIVGFTNNQKVDQEVLVR